MEQDLAGNGKRVSKETRECGGKPASAGRHFQEIEYSVKN
jgi:hypothetical protein